MPGTKGEMQILALPEFEDFSLQTQLSAKMVYLSLVTVGMARVTAGDWDGVIACLGDALDQNAESVAAGGQGEIYFYRGYAYLNKGDYDKAIADCDRAIQLKPDLAEAYVCRGLGYFDRDDYGKAIEDHTRAIQLKPNLAWAYQGRATAYGVKGRYDEGIEDCNQAIRLRHEARSYVLRGMLYGAKGEKGKALADWSRAWLLTQDARLREFLQQQLRDLAFQ